MEIHRNHKRSKRKKISIFKTILTNQIIYIYIYIVTSSPPLFKFSSESLIPQPFPELLQQSRKHLIVAATCHDFGNAIQRYTCFQFNSHRLMQNDKERCRSSSMRKEWKEERRVKGKEDPKIPFGDLADHVTLRQREPRNRVNSCGSFANLNWYIPYPIHTNNL